MTNLIEVVSTFFVLRLASSDRGICFWISSLHARRWWFVIASYEATCSVLIFCHSLLHIRTQNPCYNLSTHYTVVLYYFCYVLSEN